MTHEKRQNRVFFAISLTPATIQSISDYLYEIRKHFKRHAIRWLHPENLHITLQFLGAVEDQDLKPLIENVRQQVKNFPPFSLALGPLELFPTPYHPKIISLRANPHEALKLLAEKVGRGITPLNYHIDKRPFRGHLSLGRIIHAIDHNALIDVPQPKLEELSIHSIVLYRSELTLEGSRYTVLESLLF